MDVTERPYRIPPELYSYAEKHKVFQLFQYLLERLIVERPEDPLQFFCELLKHGFYDVPQVFVLGPPVTDRKMVCSSLCLALGTVHLTRNSLLETSATDLREEIQNCADIQKIPANLWSHLFKNRVLKPDCRKNGWVMEGFPRTRDQAFILQKIGVFPTHIVVLEVPDSPVTRTSGDEDMFIHSPEEKLELSEFRQQIPVIIDIYRRACLKTYIADSTVEDLAKQVLRFVQSRPRSMVPYVPRIILLGPRGSGRRTIAQMLHRRYHVIPVDFQEVLQQEAMTESPFQHAIQAVLETEDPVPDDLLARVVARRLMKNDCLIHGWVMCGFPFTVGQARELLELLEGFQINRAIFLHCLKETCLKRTVPLLLDPVTGHKYHLHDTPSQKIVSRLVQRPQDTVESVTAYYDFHYTTRNDLRSFLSREMRDDIVVTVNAEGYTANTFETVESIILRPPSRKVLENVEQSTDE